MAYSLEEQYRQYRLQTERASAQQWYDQATTPATPTAEEEAAPSSEVAGAEAIGGHVDQFLKENPDFIEGMAMGTGPAGPAMGAAMGGIRSTLSGALSKIMGKVMGKGANVAAEGSQVAKTAIPASAKGQDATFAYHQQIPEGIRDQFGGKESVPFYHITKEGHEAYQSTVTAETLGKYGLKVPETPADVASMKQAMMDRLKQQQVGRLKDMTITTRPHEEVARELVENPRDTEALRMIFPNTTVNDTGLMAFKDVVDPELTKLVGFAREGNSAAFQQQWKTLQEVVPAFLGTETAVARSEAMANPPIKPTASTARDIAGLAMDSDIQDIQTFMNRVANLRTTEERHAAILQATAPSSRGFFKYLFINGLLSPASDVINFVATGGQVLAAMGERAMGARMGQVAQMFGGQPGIHVGEDDVMFYSLFNSLGDALRLAGRAFRQDAPLFGTSRLERPSERPLPPGVTNLEEAGWFGRGMDYLLQGAGLTGRGMMTGDEFLKVIAANQEAGTLMYRQAFGQLERGEITQDQFNKAMRSARVQKYYNLPPDLMSRAEDMALYTTLNQKLGKFGTAFMNLRDTADNLTGIGGTVVQPFIRTLGNAVKQAGERTPLAFASRAVWQDILGNDPIKRDAALGKVAFGTMFMSFVVALSNRGYITGHLSPDPDIAEAQRQKGLLEDTIGMPGVHGNRVQYGRLNPYGNLIGAGATIGRVWHLMNEDQQGEAAAVLLQGFLATFDMGFIKNSAGIASFIAGKGTKDDVNDFVKMMTPIPGSIIPYHSLLRIAERHADPYQKQIKPGLPLTEEQRESGAVEEAWGKTPAGFQFNTAVERLLAAVPGYNTFAKKYGLPEVFAKRNYIGEKVELPTDIFGTQSLGTMLISREKDDPFLGKLIELGAGIKPPPSILTVGEGASKVRVPLTPKEYDKYQEDAGAMVKEGRERVLQMLRPDMAPLMQRNILLDYMHNQWKAAAAKAFSDPKRYPDLQGALGHMAATKGSQLSGRPPVDVRIGQ